MGNGRRPLVEDSLTRVVDDETGELMESVARLTDRACAIRGRLAT